MMSFLKGKNHPKICPKTGKIISSDRKFKWPWWLLPFTGLAALIWFLVRVIPKPSRATYPCQRVAFPLASGFIVWLAGLAVSTIAFHKAKRHLVRARYVLAAICIVVSVTSIYVALSYTSQDDTLAATPPLRVPQPANAPIGIGKGVNPARVAWIHDPNSTNWGGTSNGYWWEPNHTSQAVVDKMVSKTLRAITGENTDYAAWDAIFRYFNQQQGKGDVGYQPGEKIMIKVNFVGFFYSSTGGSYTYHSNYPNNSPQVIHAILDQLVNVVGVKDADITVGDTLGTFVNDFYNMLHPDFPDVNCLDYYGTSGRGKTGLSSTRVYWSTSSADGKTNDYVPNAFKNASYLINLATLKGHYNQAGITLCGKNHYGSLVRVPSAGGYYNLHDDQIYADGKSGMGHYRNLVDLMGHPHIGGKTLLFLVDGLYAGKHMALDYPIKWLTAPFNNDWPSSLFASQDPVAIDSVALDFLLKEYPTENNGPAGDGADDYLHEAALVPDPPSDTNYDPNRNGGLTASLGVHEHWNDPNLRQYTRNLSTGDGIELVTTAPGQPDLNGDWEVDFKDLAILAKAWRSTPSDTNWDPNCDISSPADNVIDENDLMVLCDNWLGKLAAGLIAPHAKLQQVYSASSTAFEGPTWDPNSNKLFFTKRPTTGPNQILRLDSPGSATVWMNNAPKTNGTLLALDGRLLTADEDLYQIRSHRIGASGPEDTVVLANTPKKPNDLCELTNGDIYFTCPDWNGVGPSGQGVYLLEPNGVIARVNNTLYQPNGIITSLDETKLYVAESSSSDVSKKRWWVFQINSDGTLDTGSVFFKPASPPATNDPDGMTIDEHGDLYFTGLGGVWIVSPTGQQLKLIRVTENCSNICFGGPDYKTLYITCQNKVYSLEMLVRGGE